LPLLFLQTEPVGAYTIPDTGQTKCYDNWKEIPCPRAGRPFHGQDAQYQGAQPAYRDNGDGTVSDLNTGLMWQQADDQNDAWRSWYKAIDYCETLTLADHGDWRLPTVQELTSLTNIGRYAPAIDTQFFPQCLSAVYWSVSPRASNPDYAWFVSFVTGNAFWYDKYSNNCVRCVREGP